MLGLGRDKFPVVGILGGGQLGRMTALAGIRMGLQIRFLASSAEGPIDGIGESIIADWTDHNVLHSFASGCAVVTVESEWAPAEILAEVLPAETALWPSPQTINTIRHKGLQKEILAKAGLPVPEFKCCTVEEEALAAAGNLGYPVLLKRYRGSYDGYGNATVESADDLRENWPDLSDKDGLLVEAWVPFIRELSVLIARRPDGKHVIYPVAETQQRDHRCHAVMVPAPISPAVEEEAKRVALAAVEAVKGIGLVAIELFELSSGRVLINEMAPRPHNTGHYSIEACYTSQFENHLRAILGWPLGSPDLRAPASVMVNILGQRTGIASTQGLDEALDIPGVSVHIYGKKEVKPKRKMGHVTITGEDLNHLRTLAEEAASSIIL